MVEGILSVALIASLYANLLFCRHNRNRYQTAYRCGWLDGQLGHQPDPERSGYFEAQPMNWKTYTPRRTEWTQKELN